MKAGYKAGPYTADERTGEITRATALTVAQHWRALGYRTRGRIFGTVCYALLHPMHGCVSVSYSVYKQVKVLENQEKRNT